ncbi:sensor histidine kinase [Parasalinivibrio latis]|uniref:sensor histidine kinase n=1 Tax=Parasalinivibrio latis TaxID=2952610 RepID=UPI0030E0F1E5
MMNKQITALSGRGLLVTMGFCVVVSLFTQSLNQGWYSTDLAISVGFGLSCHGLNMLVNRWFPAWSTLLQISVATVIGVCLGLLNMMFWVYLESGRWLMNELAATALIAVVLSVAISFFFVHREIALKAEADLREARMRESEQQRALVQSQLMTLQSQIEPHFLFNTLATLDVLIVQDPEKARLLLSKITELLRANLRHNREDSVTLADEKTLLDNYLSIQQLRLGERMTFRISVDEKLSPDTLIPPYMIQPLVENAVVHGIEPDTQSGHIDVRIMRQGNRLVTEVEDNGQGMGSNGGHGVSLTNIRSRLATLYGENGKLTLKEGSNGGFIAKVEWLCG